MSCYPHIDVDTRYSINHSTENIIIMESAVRRFRDGFLKEADIITLRRLLDDTKSELDFTSHYANEEMQMLKEKAQEKQVEIDILNMENESLKKQIKDLEFKEIAKEKGYVKGVDAE